MPEHNIPAVLIGAPVGISIDPATGAAIIDVDLSEWEDGAAEAEADEDTIAAVRAGLLSARAAGVVYCYPSGLPDPDELTDALGWLADQASERGDRGRHAATLTALIAALRR